MDVWAKRGFRKGTELGGGSYGRVYKAQHMRGGVFAVKVIRFDQEGDLEKQRKKSADEIAVHKKMKHPFIAQCIESWHTKHHVYIVMEFASGGTLMTQMREGKVQKYQVALKRTLLLQMASALAYIHGNRILHRDLKPSNVALTVKNRKLIAKLIDFGESIMSTNGRRSKDSSGTPEYMSYEKFNKNRGPSHSKYADDMWSLGVITYELAVGEDICNKGGLLDRCKIPVGRSLCDSKGAIQHCIDTSLKVDNVLGTVCRALLVRKESAEAKRASAKGVREYVNKHLTAR